MQGSVPLVEDRVYSNLLVVTNLELIGIKIFKMILYAIDHKALLESRGASKVEKSQKESQPCGEMQHYGLQILRAGCAKFIERCYPPVQFETG